MGGQRPTFSAGSAQLELFEANGAFTILEDWLAGQGFFRPGGESLAADLYLGYGLSQALRRHDEPPPPEPCPLPLLAAVVRQDNYGVEHGNRRAISAGAEYSIGAWRRTWRPAEYAAAVAAAQESIGRGDVYQVNLVQHLEASFAGSTDALSAQLRALTQPRDWPLTDGDWRVFDGDGWSIVSASPELFLARRGQRIWTMPIKGTRPRGWAAELHGSVKDAAEHVMIVDLERNDLSRVCRAGSVRWPQLMATEPLAGVEHMVSLVEGELRGNVGLAEILDATFPGGSITGAPKIAAIDLIAELEPVGRGAAMGALGRIHGNGDLELALTIRTFAVADGRIHLWVGGGIVWDSKPIEEVAESLVKAEPLLDAIGAPLERSTEATALPAAVVPAEATASPTSGSVARQSAGGGQTAGVQAVGTGPDDRVSSGRPPAGVGGPGPASIAAGGDDLAVPSLAEPVLSRLPGNTDA